MMFSQDALSDFFTFLSFESISSEPKSAPHMIACRQWLSSYLERMGFNVEVWETGGHATLFASNDSAGKEAKTLLIYNHYDVQPVDPLELWESPPFEPTVRGGKVYARGAQDNKGQCFFMLTALKRYKEVHGSFPLNIKLCIEGEEEIGSVGLAKILETKKTSLKADYLAVVDCGYPDPKRPAISLGTRGIVTFDVELTGSTTDLHSGSHGGIAYNPIRALVEILSSFYGASGEVQIDGFYASVIDVPENIKKQVDFTFDEAQYAAMTGAIPQGGEQEYPPLMRAFFRPTLEINGIWGGYTGEGFKTVIPAKAHAKLSCRLVPNQVPREIASLVKNAILARVPKGIAAKVTLHEGVGGPVFSSPNSPVLAQFKACYEKNFQKPCGFVSMGGSIPIIEQLAKVAQAEVIFLGLGLPEDQIHAPNESFSLDRLEVGTRIFYDFLTHYDLENNRQLEK